MCSERLSPWRAARRTTAGKQEFLDDKRDTITYPRLVVEVLSPSTRNYDLGDKTRMYWQIPSLTDHLLIEQDKVLIEYWSRETGGKWDRQVPEQPRRYVEDQVPRL